MNSVFQQWRGRKHIWEWTWTTPPASGSVWSSPAHTKRSSDQAKGPYLRSQSLTVDSMRLAKSLTLQAHLFFLANRPTPSYGPLSVRSSIESGFEW